MIKFLDYGIIALMIFLIGILISRVKILHDFKSEMINENIKRYIGGKQLLYDKEEISEVNKHLVIAWSFLIIQILFVAKVVLEWF